MAGRGRPPATRQRVLGYIEKHKPATVMQIVRGTGADRRHIYRILNAAFGQNFRSDMGYGANVAFSAISEPVSA